jgi:DNA repair protein REV1
MMKGLANEVAKRMAHVGVKGSKVSLKLKQRKQGALPPPKFLGHGSCHNLSRCCEVPSDAATRDSEVLFQCGMKLLDEICVNRDDIRGMGYVPGVCLLSAFTFLTKFL